MRDLRFDKKRADSGQNRLSIAAPYVRKKRGKSYVDFFTSSIAPFMVFLIGNELFNTVHYR